MRIKVKPAEGRGINLWLPTSLLKSKFIVSIIKKNIDNKTKIYLDMIPQIYKSLKKYIKQNGHFILVDVDSSDGDKVLIKV